MSKKIPTQKVTATELKSRLGTHLEVVRQKIRLIVTHYNKPIVSVEPCGEDKLTTSEFKELSITAFKSRLGAWLEAVQRGTPLILTCRGKAFATIKSLQANLFPEHPTTH